MTEIVHHFITSPYKAMGYSRAQVTLHVDAITKWVTTNMGWKEVLKPDHVAWLEKHGCTPRIEVSEPVIETSPKTMRFGSGPPLAITAYNISGECQIGFAFPDLSTAMLWKLTWGGK